MSCLHSGAKSPTRFCELAGGRGQLLPLADSRPVSISGDLEVQAVKQRDFRIQEIVPSLLTVEGSSFERKQIRDSDSSLVLIEITGYFVVMALHLPED